MVAPSHLKSLQALELAIRTGSLKSAAEVLSITPAAVGQRVKALEDFLGIELLVRGRSGLKATASMAAASPHLAAAFRELESAAALLDLERGHEIHIAAGSDFTELWLRPRIGAFKALHPNIRVNINGEGDAAPRFGQVDCDISFGPVRAEADLLFRDFVVPISSPENTQRISALPDEERLEGFPLLHLDFYKDDPAARGWAGWIAAFGHRRTAPDRGIRFQTITPALQAVLADAGLTICGLALIAELVEDGRVSLPFPLTAGVWTEHAFQARFRHEASLRPQVRRFRQWLIQQSEATQAWLAATAAKAGVVGSPGSARAG